MTNYHKGISCQAVAADTLELSPLVVEEMLAEGGNHPCHQEIESRVECSVSADTVASVGSMTIENRATQPLAHYFTMDNTQLVEDAGTLTSEVEMVCDAMPTESDDCMEDTDYDTDYAVEEWMDDDPGREGTYEDADFEDEEHDERDFSKKNYWLHVERCKSFTQSDNGSGRAGAG
jgi:hypothetical protein